MNRMLIRHIGFSLVAAVLMLAGSTVFGQNDSPYVIKIKQDNQDHYLAHVNNGTQWVVTDATEFSPNCIWYSGIEQNISGTNHNYYFDDGANLRFLSAPMSPNGSLGLSDNLPATYLLSNTDTIYFFYDWDSDNTGNGGGVARGHQYTGYNEEQCNECGASWEGGNTNECWRVYWIAYFGGWKLTSRSYYDINDIVPADDGVGGRFRLVTVEDIKNTVSGGLADLSGFEMNFNENHSLAASVSLPYTYKSYTHYSFEENGTSHHYYYDNADHNAAPTQANGSSNLVASYEWTLSGPGAAFLSFDSGSMVDIISTSTPTLYYRVENTHGDTQATLKLKVTYDNGTTQETSALVTVKTRCQNPEKLEGSPVVNYEDVLVEWYNIADSYKVYWRKVTNPASTWSSSSVVTDNFYAFVGLEPDTKYEYKVHAFCGGVELTEQPEHVYTFTTRDEHELLVYGAIFGGGRMANVTGKTEVMVVNCDSIGAIYGGNDIAGEVLGAGGSTITLGNNSGTGAAITSSPVKVGSVYGGGNGYYAYNQQPSGSVSFTPVAAGNTSVTVAPGHRVIGYNVLENQWANVVWTNSGTSDVTLTVPSITKTAINVVNDYVKVDTIFGGAKNAFITADTGNGSDIAINGGTIVSVFGGNNVGGSQGQGKHHIKVDEASNTATTNYATRIHTLFGGGNKVAGSETDILVNGGMIDTLYAGGNSADVAAAKVEVNCALAEGSGENTFGHVYSSAIESYSGGEITIKNNYPWNGTGVYNITALFGGNNQADMEVVPTITLTSGSVGTVYGGGNAGDMVAQVDSHNDAIADDFGALYVDYSTSQTSPINVSTHVVLESDNMVIDYLYGGCQMSNVYRSAWVEMSRGHVGTVYGGCNISGDVGSRYLFQDGYNYRPKHEKYQAVLGATYVKVSGGHIYRDLFAGSNGRYHCNNGKVYVAGIDFDDLDTEGRYIGLPVPSHNETHVYVSDGEVDGNVYAGGNLACVGFINQTVPLAFYTPVFVGMATVRMTGGHVYGSVFGGGNMASIWGSNGVSVEGGTIEGALYGGNDRIGLVAQITNRVLPPDYGKASDGYTPLDEVRTYISLTGRPLVSTVYGGGNGDYDYSIGQYCNPNDQPVQSNTFVDVNIDGYVDGDIPAGHIHTVYGGGNGVTVTGSTTVFLNVKGDPNNGGAVAQGDHVDFIFGGNNKGPLAILPDIILLKGNVNTVYGGCNQGSMIGNHSVDNTYHNIGSLVRLRSSYDGDGDGPAVPVTPTAKVTGAVFGGCRMNGVDYNTLVLVEGGQHPASMFGGSDISGTISGTSQVVVTGGQTGNIYGGGNGNYYYNGNKVYDINDHLILIDTIESGTVTAPVSAVSQVDILGGQVGASDNRAYIFGGGYGQLTRTDGDVTVNISRATGENPPAAPSIYGDIYGGSALGSVNAENTTTNKTTVNILDGSITGDVYGGGLGDKTNDIPAIVNGKVYVNIGAETNTGRMGNAAFYTYGEGNSLGGRVFGGNNVFGSPQDSIFVNVYKTAHGADPANNLYPTTPPNPYPGWTVEALAANSSVQTYAIQSVYGGGNQASYTPPLTSDNKPRSAKVHVHYCDNTIKDVYGGGNAADVGTTGDGAVPTNTFVIVDGGRIDRVFGGGNGEVTPANIYGTSSNTVKGGLINQVFGCGNMQGSITQTNLNLSDTGDCSDEVFGEVFGGANQAQFTGNLATEIICGVGQIGSIYGGSNLAPIVGNVTLTIRGGDFKEVYGGSKGATAPANIYGNVTLNLHGGTIIQAFGGSNVNGNITGLITVNVDTIAGTCPLVLDTLFGSGNLTAYTPNRVEDNLITSPVVNLKNGTVRKAVFGSGKGTSATVTANPQVNIGDPDNNSDLRLAQVGYMDGSTVYGGDIYGGGFKGAVEGGPVVNIRKANTMVYNSVFGGGDMANVSSTLVNMYNGTVKTGIYGGCNLQGTVGGNIEVNIVGGVLGVEGTPMPGGIFGGGYGQETATTGNVVLNIGDASNNPTIYADVYGGSALGKVNNVGKQTKVNFAKGTLHGNLYGGGLGQASPVIPALVNGNVEVNIGKDKDGATVDGGVIIGSVFGANNIKGTPLGNVQLNVYSGTLDSIFGGGNQANYEPTDASISYPAINVSSGEVIYKVVGGGNAAGVTANPHVNISGGKICTIPTGLKAGVYGGCNTTGTVNGNIVMNITSPANTADTTVIGTLSAIQYALSHNSLQAVSVHGGGYGANTATTGNITVTYGEDDGSADAECKYPKLYGDLYGGSALGSVNSDGDDVTMVKVLNGSLKFLPAALDNICGGSIYGGGLGDASHAATVNGKVHVYIGSLENGYRRGKAYLKGCDVFGCNNVNGSPQDDVYVDLWQTAHEEIDSVHYNDGTDMGHERYYAIRNVYGGGNRSHYAPVGNAPGYEKKVHNTVHECDNTVQNLYGGGNASDTDGTVVSVDGGRFKYIFGGGNGQVTAANILGGHVDITVYGGTVNWYFVGCNLHGSVGEGNTEHVGCSGDDCPCPDTLVVNNYYFGANEALTLEGLDHEINCGDNMDFRNVYAGSRLAVVYGDIKLTVRGGNITNLFGGSEGSSSVIADVRKYPMDTTSIPDSLIDLRLYMRDSLTHGHDIRGKGGNIRLILEGGSIKNVYGGNNENGNVEGEITIIVDSTQAHPCELDIDYIYSGNKHSNYLPDSIVVGGHKELPVSPAVYVKNGHVNNVVYGGSQGGESSLATSVGLVKSKPLVVIGDNDPSHKVLIGQHVYGGGSKADVIGDPSVVLQGNATVGGNVFGGGEQGDITGSAQVTIAPTEYVDTPSTPVPSSQALTIESVPNPGGTISVTFTSGGASVSSGDQIEPGVQLSISKTVNPGYVFKNWSAYNANFNSDSTIVVKGSGVAKLMANFTPQQTLSYEVMPSGTGTVTVTVHSSGAAVSSGEGVTQGTVLDIVAAPQSGFVFEHWTVTGDGTVYDPSSASTTFTMGAGNATLTATFSSAP